MTAPVVFISYSHDSQEHKLWVLQLAIRLRQSGVDAILDQWDLGPGADLPHFMEQSVAKAARIIMICTERYVQKADSGEGGVGYEKMIVTPELMKNIDSRRVIPVLRQASAARMPVFLGSKLYIDLSTTDVYETGVDQLLRELLGAPLFQKPPIGADPFKTVEGQAKPTTAPPALLFMIAVASVYENSSDGGAVRTEWAREAMGSSKLFFDHAFDQAISLKYVSASPDRQTIWVHEEGRAAALQLQAGAGGT